MKSFSILKGRAHIIELPETNWPYRDLSMRIRAELGNQITGKILIRDSSLLWQELELPPGTWKIVGMLPEVTESEAFDIVDSYHVSDNMDLTATYAFKDYVNGDDDADDYWDEYMLDTALESLESSILAEGYTFQSTPKPENKDFYWGYLEDLAKWEAAQSRVLCRERCLVLRRVAE